MVVAALAVILSFAGQPALYSEFRSLSIYDLEIRDDVRANLQQLGLAVDLYAAYLLALGLILTLGCFAIAIIIFIRGSTKPMPLFVSLVLVLIGATFSGAIGASGDTNQVLEWLQGFLGTLSLGTILLLFYVFPDGRFVPRFVRWPAIISALYIVVAALMPDSPLNPEQWTGPVYALIIAGMLFLGVVAQIYRYRRISDYWQRQQTKWVVLGFTVALSGYLGVGILPSLSPSLQPGTFADLIGAAAVTAFMLCIPLSFGIAILRYKLWDIDVVIHKTLVYGLLSSLLLALYFGSVIMLQSIFRTVAGQNSELAIIISTLAIAMLFQPLRRRVQTFIDHRFYRSRHDTARTLDEFSGHLRHQVDLPVLSGELISVVQETMQPASISLWIKPPARSDHLPYIASQPLDQRS